MRKPIVVLKIGTSAITRKDGSLDEPVMVDIARQVARLHNDYRLVLVSSGAVGTGRRFLPNYSGTITERKAAAAIGNPILINTYSQFFAPYGISLAQSLCERQHFSHRPRFLQLRDTFETLWHNGVIPIANENDVVSDLELRFSDNDELATLIAVGFGASCLLLGTSVPGLMDAGGEVIARINRFDGKVMGLARKEKSDFGLGGMISKLTFARLATRMGIKVVIFGLHTPDGVLKAMQEQTGTLCPPRRANIPARNKWLASGSLVNGRLLIDPGAWKALQNRKSLLAVGVTKVQGEFNRGEVIEIAGEEGSVQAVARARVSSRELKARESLRDLIIAHADDIVLL